MERFRSCPICTEGHLKEIYQCSEGHIICGDCISKVVGGLCPQCRVPFGSKKIRNRALEEILELEDFNCQFKEFGCEYSCKRSGIANHSKSCTFNPVVPLCELLTGKDDEFRFTSVSKDDIASHFKFSHNCFQRRISSGAWFVAESGGFLRSIIDRKSGVQSTPSYFLRLFSFESSEFSPLFLIYGQLNRVEGVLSVGCIKVYDSEFNQSLKYSVEFQLTRNGNYISPLRLGGSMIVSCVAEARQTLNKAPVNFSTEMLKNLCFGLKMGDSLAAKIVQVAK